jgi:hypothetical protein
MNAIKTYILVPNFDIPAEGPNAMRLGHIIFDPTNPNIPLNRSTVVPFTDDLIPARTVKPGWTGTISQLREKKFGIWARFLEIIGLRGKISVHSIGDNDNYFTFESLETIYIDPSDEYVKKSMDVDGVKRFLEAGRFKKPVYMITGMKIARGASAIGSQTVVHGGEAKLGFDGTFSGVPVALGPEVEVSSSKTNAVSFEGAEGFAFAIRLRKISYKMGRDLVHREYREGVVLDDDDEVGEEEEEEGVEVLGIDLKDEEFIGVTSMRVAEEDDGSEVQCIVVSKAKD